MRLRVGTRKSKLALIQADFVVNEIKKHYPNADCQIVAIVTSGDLITDKNLYDIGGKALFLKEIEQALLEDKIDIAVHSLKDVPGRLPEGLMISAVLEREDARDVLVSTKFRSIKDLPVNAKVGCSSVRRQIFLKQQRPDLEIIMFRGNVDSRVKKLLQGLADATILAAAGLNRLSLFDDIYCHIIPINEMLPAVGQGVIALEIKTNNIKMQELCQKINHKPTWYVIEAERSFLEYLDADCKTPMAAYSRFLDVTGNNIVVDFMLSDFVGKQVLFHTETGSVQEARQLGLKAAKALARRMMN